MVAVELFITVVVVVVVLAFVVLSVVVLVVVVFVVVVVVVARERESRAPSHAHTTSHECPLSGACSRHSSPYSLIASSTMRSSVALHVALHTAISAPTPQCSQLYESPRMQPITLSLSPQLYESSSSRLHTSPGQFLCT